MTGGKHRSEHTANKALWQRSMGPRVAPGVSDRDISSGHLPYIQVFRYAGLYQATLRQRFVHLHAYSFSVISPAFALQIPGNVCKRSNETECEHTLEPIVSPRRMESPVGYFPLTRKLSDRMLEPFYSYSAHISSGSVALHLRATKYPRTLF